MVRLVRQRGMTLVEILVIVAIVALVASVAVASIGSLGRTRLRGSAYMVAAAVQRAFSYAATHGENARIVVDLDEHVLTIEGGEGRLLVDRSVEGGVEDPDEEGDEVPADEGGGDEEDSFDFDLGVETLTEQIRTGFHAGEVPRYKPPVFAPIPGHAFDGRELEPRVQFLAVHSFLYDEPKREGEAYIYFFPDGMGDHAVVQLTNRAGEIYSVEVQPLMGRAAVYNYAFVPDLAGELD
jgi:prepilin-type N-terminal cleavage/methylation domain-containing protein